MSSNSSAMAERFQERWQREWPDTADWLRRWQGVWLVSVVFILSTPVSLIGVRHLGWPTVLAILAAFTTWLFATLRSTRVPAGLNRLGWVSPQQRWQWPVALIAGAMVAGILAICTTALGLPLRLGNPMHDRVISVTIGPVWEELLFRGFLQTWLASRLKNPWLAVTIVAVVFAAIHLPWQGVRFACILSAGLVYGLLRVYTRSTAATALGHIAYNGTTLVLVRLVEA